jgi:hypothetical protein
MAMKSSAVRAIAEPRYALLAALACGAMATPAAARTPEASSAVQAAADQAELAAEAATDAIEASEAAVEQAETAAETSSPYEFKSRKAAEEYPAYARKIEHIRAAIGKVSARKASLKELPLHAKLRKRGVAETTARIKEERHHLREVRANLRAKKVAARE